MTATPTTSPDLEASTTIAARPEQVWVALADLTRMSRWSPQVKRTWVLGGEARLGSLFVNLNGQGRKRWPTTAKVVRFDPHVDLAFRIVENKSVWSFQLEPTDGGTRVTHRRETPDGISGLSRVLTKVALGGQESFAAELQSGMERTLTRLKAELES